MTKNNLIGLSQADIENIFKSDIAKDIKDFIKVVLFSGCRMRELTTLTKNNIIVSGNSYFINIKSGKNINAIRQIPIHSKIKDIILGRIANTKNDTLLFANINSARTVKVFRTVIIDINKSFHSIRKTFYLKLCENSSNDTLYIDAITGRLDNATEKKLDDNMKIKMIESIDYNI